MNRDRSFVIAAMVAALVLIVLLATGWPGAPNNKTAGSASAGDAAGAETAAIARGGGAAEGSAGTRSAPVIVANTNSQPLPVAPQGVSHVTGEVGISNPASNPVPVSVQGQVGGNVGINNTHDNPVPVTLPNTATVQLDPSSAGHLASLDAAANKLAFDAAGNLKTAPSGTQNVHIVGGVLTQASGAALANKGFVLYDGLKTNQDKYYDVTVNGVTTTLNVSLLSLKAPDVVEVEFYGPGIEFDLAGSQRGVSQVYTFAQQMPINRLHITCTGLNGCIFKLNLVGN